MKKIKTMKLLLILAVLFYPGAKVIRQSIALQNSDVIFRVAFRGLENMFHVPYEYYAIGSYSSCKIPEWVVKKRFGEEVETRSIYDGGEETDYWTVNVNYYAYDKYLQKKNDTIETAIGEQYRIIYNAWRSEHAASEEEVRVMVQVAEKLYNYHIRGPQSQEESSFSIFYFVLAHCGEDYLIEDYYRKILYRITKKGKIVKVMEIPERGQFDYYYFYGED